MIAIASRRLSAVVAAILIPALTLVACGSSSSDSGSTGSVGSTGSGSNPSTIEDDETSSSSTATSASDDATLTPVTLRLDWQPQGYQAPFFVAEELGYYREAGLDVTINDGSGTGDTIKLVANGNDTFGFGSVGTMAFADAQQGVGLTAVAGVFQEAPDAIFVRESTGITKPEQLAGHSIVANPERPLFPAFAEAVGLDPKSVKFLSVGSSTKTSVFINGRGDALDQFVTVAFRLEQAGVKTRVFKYADYGAGVLSQGVLARADYVKEHPATVQAFVGATMKGLSYTIEHPEDAIEMIAKQRDQSAEDLEIRRAELNASLPLLFTSEDALKQPLGFMSSKAWANSIDIMVKYQDMTEIDAQSVYTNDFVEKAAVPVPEAARDYTN